MNRVKSEPWSCSYLKSPRNRSLFPTSKSSAKADYRAISSACSEIVWLHRVIQELGFSQKNPTLHEEKYKCHKRYRKSCFPWKDKTYWGWLAFHPKSFRWSYYHSPACTYGSPVCKHIHKSIDKTSTPISNSKIVASKLPSINLKGDIRARHENHCKLSSLDTI